jgi:very-short-patch-repair endonuclease
VGHTESLNRGRSAAGDGIDWTIARLAARQHGVVSRGQLLAAGATAWAIEWRIASGRLHGVHRGVYRVGHDAPSRWVREMAAVLACQPDAVVSHRAAARMWELPLDHEREAEVEVLVVRSRAPRLAGIVARRTSRLDAGDVTRLAGVPLTTPARTLLDLAAVESPAGLERALAQAQVRNLVDRRSLRGQLRRNPRRAGTRALREALEGGPAPTRSEAERSMLRLLRAAELPQPAVNVRVGRYEVDFLWRDQRVVLEVDGYAYHGNRRAFEKDRERDATLAAWGYVVLRVTWRQIVDAQHAVVARIAATLALAGRSGPGDPRPTGRSAHRD